MRAIKPLNIPQDARVVVVTGAGISAESGIPTFRDPGGIWQRYDPEKVATPQGFARDPDLVWRFYSERRLDAAKCQPNAGHLALVGFERYLSQRGKFLLVTQNVDGLHQRAGSRNVIEIHGSLFRTKCSNPQCSLEPFEDHQAYLDGAPRCELCGSYLRPDVVWFGELLNPADDLRAREAISTCDVFLAIGTSGAVYPVAGYVQLATLASARTICVNLEPPENVHYFDEFYRGKAAELLPVLLGQ